MEAKKYDYLDCIRGMGVLLVVFVHTTYVTNTIFMYTGTIWGDIILSFRNCIQLFFISSAFALTMSYFNRIDEKNKTRNFFIRRFFRIAPLYYIAIVAATVKFIFDEGSFSIGGLITNMLFINGLFPEYSNRYVPGGWSISVEYVFYFMMPFLCSRIRSLNSALIFVLVSFVFSAISRYILTETGFDYEYIYYSIFSQLPIFAIGMLVYWILNDSISNVKAITILMIAGVLVFFTFAEVPQFYIYGVISLFYVLALHKKPFKLFVNKVFIHMGRVSLSMYIVHFGVISVMVRLGAFMDVEGTWQVLLSVLGMYILITYVSYIISHFTYKYIEVAGQNLGKKLIKKLDQRQ